MLHLTSVWSIHGKAFLFKYTNMLTSSGVKQDLNLVTVNPAVENTRSAGVEVIGMVRYLLATRETRGNLC